MVVVRFQCVTKCGEGLRVIPKLHVSAHHFVIIRRPRKARWRQHCTSELSQPRAFTRFSLVNPEALPSTHRATAQVSPSNSEAEDKEAGGSILPGRDTALIIWLLRSDWLILKLGFIGNILNTCMLGTPAFKSLNLFKRGNGHTKDRMSPLPSSVKVLRVSSMPALSLTPSMTVLPPILV